jgi:hypothetical protein
MISKLLQNIFLSFIMTYSVEVLEDSFQVSGLGQTVQVIDFAPLIFTGGFIICLNLFIFFLELAYWSFVYDLHAVKTSMNI